MNLKLPLPLRIAILECDTPLPETKKKFQGYGGVFELLLRTGAKALDRADFDVETGFEFSRWQVELEPGKYPDPENIDAILITGSRHDSFVDTPWINSLVDYVAKILNETSVRVIGVCFGHQIVGRALKAGVGRNPDGWEAAVNDVQLSEKGKEIFGVDKIVSQSSTVLFLKMWLAHHNLENSNRASTKCTETSCSSTHRAWKHSAHRPSAQCKACTCPRSSSPSKATRNSTRRS